MSNSAFTGVILNNTKAATTTLNNVIETADGFSLTVLKGSSGSHTTLNFDSVSVSGTNDVLNLIYNGNGSTQLGALTAQGIETIKIVAGGVISNNGVNLTADSAKLISITGDQTYSLTVQAQGNITGSTVSQLTTVDGSQATGPLTIQVMPTTTGAQSALTLIGGSGGDTFDVYTSAVANSKGVIVTTNGGNDTVIVSNASLRDVSTLGNLQFTTITDFTKGDSLQLPSSVNFQAAAVNVSAAGTDLLQALQLAAAGNNNNYATWFQLAGDSYLVVNRAAGTGLTADDVVVKLGGITDLSGLQGSGGNTLTL